MRGGIGGGLGGGDDMDGSQANVHNVPSDNGVKEGNDYLQANVHNVPSDNGEDTS